MIEKSADQMDEIQCATERDLAIGNLDRESGLLREVKDAMRRIHDGAFGACIVCESAISPKRLAAVPWAALCIECQEAADRDREDNGNLSAECSSMRRDDWFCAWLVSKAGKGGCSCEIRLEEGNALRGASDNLLKEARTAGDAYRERKLTREEWGDRIVRLDK